MHCSVQETAAGFRAWSSELYMFPIRIRNRFLRMRGWNHRGLKSQAADVVGAVIVTVIVTLATVSLVPRVSFLSDVRVCFGSSTSLNCCLSCGGRSECSTRRSEWKKAIIKFAPLYSRSLYHYHVLYVRTAQGWRRIFTCSPNPQRDVAAALIGTAVALRGPVLAGVGVPLEVPLGTSVDATCESSTGVEASVEGRQGRVLAMRVRLVLAGR